MRIYLVRGEESMCPLLKIVRAFMQEKIKI